MNDKYKICIFLLHKSIRVYVSIMKRIIFTFVYAIAHTFLINYTVRISQIHRYELLF